MKIATIKNPLWITRISWGLVTCFLLVIFLTLLVCDSCSLVNGKRFLAETLSCHVLRSTSQSTVLIECCCDKQLIAEWLNAFLIRFLLRQQREFWTRSRLHSLNSKCCQHAFRRASTASLPLWQGLHGFLLQACSLTATLKRKERRKLNFVTPHTHWYKYHCASKKSTLTFLWLDTCQLNCCNNLHYWEKPWTSLE